MSVTRRNRWITFCCPLFFFVFLTYGADAGFAQAQTQPQNPLAEKTILILNAHESNIPGFVKTNQGLSAALQSGGIGVKTPLFEAERYWMLDT